MDDADLSSPISLIEPLTGRELEVLRLMADDLTISAVADQLVLSPATVKWYTQQIYGKLGIHEPGQKRRQAVARARALGLLEVERTPAGRPRYSLPVQTTPFVGRTQEINAIAGLLANPDVRLVTLLGPGGMGKTRLALEVGWRLVEPEAFGTSWVLFPDGVYFVPLQPVATPDNMLWAVAEAVGFPFQSDGREPQQQLLDFFREKRLLLIMDNFEHLLEGADLVSAILQAAPGVQVLVTSRETLNLHAETVRTLDGLPFPGNVEDTPAYDAARLFVLGAQRACGDFALQPEDLPALARICALVEGMPLAILLAAAWVEVLSVYEIAEEIARSFDFLTAEMRDAPRRQWSIRAVFEPTWQRLSETERSVFKRLSVFRGGCTRQAAQAVTGAGLPVLQALVNKAVLSRTPRGRYEIHELLRQYAEDRLMAAGEDDTARDAHCAYYAAFMHARESDLKGGDRQIAALDEIEADFENVRAAWDWAVGQRRVDDLKHMEWAVWRFLNMWSRDAEGLTLFQSALNLDDDRALHGRLMHRYAFFCHRMGRQREWDEWSDRSLSVAREMGEPGDLALVLRTRSLVLAALYRDFEQAYRLADESLELWRALGDTWGVAWGLQVKGVIALRAADYPSAMSSTEESWKEAQIVGDRQRIAACLMNAGVGYSCLGEPHQALHYYQASLAVFRELNPLGGFVAQVIGNIGVVAQHLGDYDTALRQFEEALALVSESGLLPTDDIHMWCLVDVLSLTGRPDEAAERLAEFPRVLSSIENESLEAGMLILETLIAYRRGDYDKALQSAQAALECTQVHTLPVEESYRWLLIGLVEIKLNHLDTARQHIRASLIDLRDKDFIMRAIYGLAALEAAREQPERAAEWAALVHHHRATAYEVKVYAGELLAELQATLPPDVYAAAVERGAQLDPDAVIAAFLQEENS
jgi:predicted ATPase/DNA-binding CsgD family transcriptional regulator